MIFNVGSLGFVNSVIIFLIVVFSVSFHEFAHALIASILGDNTAKYNGRLTLNPVAHFEPIGFLMMLFTNFGWGKPVPVNPYNMEIRRLGNTIVAIAGPISNFVLAIAASIVLHIVANQVVPVGVSFVLTMLIVINVGLAVFNLLPFPPLDGSNIYRPFLPSGAQRIMDSFTGEYMVILFLLVITVLPLIISPIITTIASFLIP